MGLPHYWNASKETMKTGFVEVKYGGNNILRHEVTNNATTNNGTTFLGKQ